MPTFESLSCFDREFAALTAEQQAAFTDALRAAVADLDGSSGTSRGLPGTRIRDTADVWAMTWAPHAYATYHYGSEQRPGEPHVVWRRIGVPAPGGG